MADVENELLDYEEEDGAAAAANGAATTSAGDAAAADANGAKKDGVKGTYVSIHSSGEDQRARGSSFNLCSSILASVQ